MPGGDLGLEHWGPGRWSALLSVTFLIGIFLAIGIFFRLGGDGYALSEQARGTLAVVLAGGVAGSWLLLAATSFLPQWRSGALLLLIVAFLANMAIPSLLPQTSLPPPSTPI